jgi:phosphatidylethanolamine/phosphatidyl-N-methylethanolamine N-methyltransferase
MIRSLALSTHGVTGRASGGDRQSIAMNESFALRGRRDEDRGSGPNRAARFFRNLECDFVEHLEFFHAFIREPGSVGALTPSSRHLAKAMIQGFDLASAGTVVELGPGTGSFTARILERIGRATTFLAMELDPVYVRNLQRRFPGLLVFNESAQCLPELLVRHGKRQADYVISGLPWANIPEQVQAQIMQAILRSLSPDGFFSTFAYLHARWMPKARSFRRKLESHFRRVETSPVVWKNLPPAIVYRCSGLRQGRSIERARR